MEAHDPTGRQRPDRGVVQVPDVSYWVPEHHAKGRTSVADGGKVWVICISGWPDRYVVQGRAIECLRIPTPRLHLPTPPHASPTPPTHLPTLPHASPTPPTHLPTPPHASPTPPTHLILFAPPPLLYPEGASHQARASAEESASVLDAVPAVQGSTVGADGGRGHLQN